MAIRIAARSLVVRKDWIDAHYPGGASQLRLDYANDDSPFAVTDDAELTAVSSALGEALVLVTDRLIELGATGWDIDRNEFGDLAIIDSKRAPSIPCSWLAWEKDVDGVAWVRFVPPPAELRMFSLGRSEGMEHQLNLDTGEILATRLRRPLDAVLQDLERRGWNVELESDALGVELFIDCGLLLTVPMQIRIFEEVRRIGVMVALPGIARCDARSRVAEFLLRANWGLTLGGFDMDFRDGEVVFRACMPFAEPELSPAIVAALIDGSLKTVETYASGLMRVGQGSDPEAVISEIEDSGDEA